ncbi:MAG: PQQ-binding-like beta-propeller repeat protein [Pirellulales bacterium]
MKQKLFYCLTIALLFQSICSAQVSIDNFKKLDSQNDWPWWRGVTRDGHANGKAPTSLDLSKNLKWAQPIPGRGHGSPTVVGQQLFVITADEEKQIHSVFALNRSTGKENWQYKLNEGGFPEENHPKNTEASPSIACDGEKLFAAVFHHKAVWLTCLSMEGKKLWEKRIADYNPTRFRYGYAASPVLYGDKVIVVYEYDGPSGLVALKTSDGSEAWRTERPSTITFSSPVVTSYQGKDYLLISGFDHIRAYNPATGKELWATPGVSTATCGTIVWDNGICFASGGYPQSETLAVKIANGEVVWRNKQRSYEQSLLATKGNVYVYTENGVLICWDAATGKEKWTQRWPGMNSASAVLADGKIYWANEAGELVVFEENGSKFKELFRGKIGDEAFASPAICGGQVYLRVAKNEGDKRQEYILRFE